MPDRVLMQSEFSRRLEKAEHESRWKLDQQLASLSDANKAQLRQVCHCLSGLFPDACCLLMLPFEQSDGRLSLLWANVCLFC